MGRKYGGKWGEIGRKPPLDHPQILPHRDAPFVPLPSLGSGPRGRNGRWSQRAAAPKRRRGGGNGPPVGDKMAAMGTRWLPWGWGTGTRWLPWGKMAAKGVGNSDKMAAMGTRWQPMDHDGRHGGWGGGQGQDGGHGDKMAAMGVGDRDKMAANGT